MSPVSLSHPGQQLVSTLLIDKSCHHDSKQVPDVNITAALGLNNIVQVIDTIRIRRIGQFKSLDVTKCLSID